MDAAVNDLTLKFQSAVSQLNNALLNPGCKRDIHRLAINPDADRGFGLWKCTYRLKRQPKFPLLRLDGTSASKGDKIAKEFADSLKER